MSALVDELAGAIQRKLPPAQAPGEERPYLLTLDQAAAMLGGMSERTVRTLAANGHVELLHVGRLARISRDSIEAYIERLRQEAAGRFRSGRGVPERRGHP